MKIGDIVKYNIFPYENEIFIIVADKKNPWEKATPYKPRTIIKVEKKKDFIILKKTKDGYGNGSDGIQVNRIELEVIKSP